MTIRASGSGLTRRQKRLVVQGRLAQPDAAAMSDRAIARELGVSQPFVSALRRRAGQQQQCGPVDRHGAGAPRTPALEPAAPRPTGDRDVLGDGLPIVESDRALDRFRDEHGPLGRVRRIYRPVDEDGETGRVLHNGDAFA